MAMTPEGLLLVKEFEGYLQPLKDGSGRVRPYLCPARVATIGWGSTFYENRSKVRLTDDPISRERASQLLAFEIEKICEPAVDKLVSVAMHPLMRDALISFTFNCGTGALAKSTLLKRVNARRWSDVPKEFGKWTRGGGRTLPGLVRRRKAEAAMFMRGVAALSERPATGVQSKAPIVASVPVAPTHEARTWRRWFRETLQWALR